ARAFLEGRNTIFDRGRANHLSLTQAHQRRTLRGINELRYDFHGPQVGGGTLVRTDELATGIEKPRQVSWHRGDAISGAMRAYLATDFSRHKPHFHEAVIAIRQLTEGNLPSLQSRTPGSFGAFLSFRAKRGISP